jgi:epoxyqueuosine reductase
LKRGPGGEDLREDIRRAGLRLGLDGVGFAAPVLPPAGVNFQDWLDRGCGAGMDYLRRHIELRLHPEKFFPGVKTVLAAILNYYRGAPAASARGPESGGRPRISRYAWGRDYHKTLPQKLRLLLAEIQRVAPGTRGRWAVDTAPVLDKLWAEAAGLGWQGRNTNLLTRTLGSWVFIGTLWLDLELPPDPHHADFCGSCTKCLDACPTGALIEPNLLDARRCISYWNVEHRGAFEKATPSFDGWLFGCDICQDVCPWNRFSTESAEDDFLPRSGLFETGLEEWAALDESGYDELTRGSALRRAKREGLRRNARWILKETRDR